VPIDLELEQEQRFLDRAHESLEAMRAESRRMLESVLDLGRGGTPQSRTERDIVVRTSLARLAQLEIGDQALCFGRIDRAPDPDHQAGESFHIGRVAVSGPDREPLVVDWRAPVAAPFYRATGFDAQGLARRRHLAVRERRVTGYEDEYFSDHHAPSPGPTAEVQEDPIHLGGPGALLAALGAARTGRMADIVATIQREQDEIIRSPLAGLLLVQGGPGTGKTAVALHRAAFLLYTHRFPLERQGVLVVGPNPLFLRYIEQVLPSLGETGVVLSTVSGLVPEVRVRATEPPEVARLKGDARMATVVARAVRGRERRLRRPVEIPFGAAVLRLEVEESARIVRRARRRPGTHNAKRRYVERQVSALLAERYQRVVQARTVSELPGGHREEDDRAELAARIRRLPEVREALARMWPRLAPHELIHDLLGAPPLLAAAARGILTPAEQALLVRPRSLSLDAVEWTAADAALVDEARSVLGPRRPSSARGSQAEARRQADSSHDAPFWPPGLEPLSEPAAMGPTAFEGDTVRSFGHIVVDEVQDLSPMQLRMLARRSLSGSMTVVGDIAQATGAGGPTSWEEVASHLSPKHPPRMVELSVSYRTPAEVVTVAARALRAAVPNLAPPTPVRRSGHPPRIEHVPSRELAGRAAELAADQLAALNPGKVAVLAPEVLVAELSRALRAQGMEPVDPRDPAGQGLGSPLVVLPATESHGLEFDGVVVVEPAALVNESAVGEAPTGDRERGLRALYVALTRPTQRLAVVHARPLPVDLAAD